MRRAATCLGAALAMAGCDPRNEPISVRVSPVAPRLVPHQRVLFEASVTSSTGDEVEWFLEGVDGSEGLGEGALGVLDALGQYTAPDRVPPVWANEVYVYACSVVEPDRCGEAEITFEPAPVEPSRGRRYEATWVRIGGEEIVEGSRVFFGALEAEEVYVDSPVVIWANAPDSEVLGAVDVRVEIPGGETIVWPQAFEYGAEVVAFDGGQFLEICSGATGRPAYGLGSDGDALQVLALPCVDEETVAVLFGDFGGNFLMEAPARVAAEGVGASGVFLADLLADAGQEVVVARAGALDVYGFPTEETAPYTPVVRRAVLPDPGLLAGAAVRGVGFALDAGGYDVAWVDRGRDLLLFAEGTGTSFAAAISLPTLPEPLALGVLDVDGDGDDDLVVAVLDGLQLFVSTGGTLVAGASVAAIDGVTDLAVADVDGDLLDDVLLSSATDPDGSIAVLLGNGAGGFAAPDVLDIDAPAESLHAVDVDGDGYPDVLVPSSSADPSYGAGGAVIVLRGGVGGLGAPETRRALDAPSFVLAPALDADGARDLLVAHANGVEVRRGRAAADWGWPTAATGAAPSSLALAVDFDAEPVAFVALAGTGTPSLAVLSLETGAILQTIPLPAGSARLLVRAADLDDDGLADAVVSGSGDASAVLVFPGADASGLVQTTPIAIVMPMAVQDFAIGDLDLDFLPDLVLALAAEDAAGTPDGAVAIAWNERGFAFDLFPGILATRVALGDAGFDGAPDIFLADAVQPRVIHLPVYEGFVEIEESLDAPVGVPPGEILIADVDGDFAPDIVVLPPGESRAGVMLGGEYHWDPPVWYPFRGDGVAIGWADVDGDALGDLLVTTGSPDPALAVFRGRDGGLFSGAPSTAIAGVDPADAAFADLDDDGMSDACVLDRAGFLLILGNRSF